MEQPEPIIFNAILKKVTLSSRSPGSPPEVAMKLEATIKPEDLRHIYDLQMMYMQVAFAPAQAIMPLEPQQAG